MNKIYKLIWSKTKNCWVVASELAKGHGKNKSRREGKSLLAVAVMTALLGSAFLPADVVYAADPAADGQTHYVSVGVKQGEKIKVRKNVYDANGHLLRVEEEEVEIDPTKNYNPPANPSVNFIGIGAELSQYGNGSVGVGFKSGAAEYGTALGTNAIAGSLGDVAIGWQAFTSGFVGNKGQYTAPNKIAIGTQSTALEENGISIGTKSKTWDKDAIAIGNEAETGNKDNTSSNDSIAIGNKAKIQGQHNVAIGSGVTIAKGTKKDWTRKDGTKKDGSSYVVAIGSNSHAYDTDSIVIGGNSEVRENATVIGNRSKAGMESVALGSGIEAGEWSIAIGLSSKAHNHAIAMGMDSDVAGEHAIGIGEEARSFANQSVSMGYQAHAYVGESLAIGNSALVAGERIRKEAYNVLSDAEKKNYTHDSYGEFYYKNDNKSYYSTAVGPQARVYGKNATALGSANVGDIFGNIIADGGTAVGSSANAAYENATAIGYKSIAYAKDAVTLGANTRADIADGVALGSESTVGRYGRTDIDNAGRYGYDPMVEGRKQESSTWKSTRAAVSVGDGDQKITRQIVNVAAGTDNTDAVNVAQLRNLKYRAEADLEAAEKRLNKGIQKNAGNISNLSTKVAGNTSSINNLKKQRDIDFQHLNQSIEGHTTRFVSVNRENTNDTSDNYLNNGATEIGSIAIGHNAHANGKQAVTLGYNSFTKGQGSVIVGESSDNYTGGLAAKKGQFDQSIILGSNNTIFAQAAKNGGREDKIIGNMNRVEESHGTFVRGTGNMVYDAYNDETLTDEDKQKERDFLDRIDGGDPTGLFQKGRSHVIVEGDGNLVGGALYTQISGVGNEVSNSQPDENSPSTPRVTYNIVTGNRNTVVDSSHNLILGDNHELKNVNGNIIIGSQKTKTKTEKSNVTILGNDANVSVEGGVALGTGSVASTAAEVAGYDLATGEASANTTSTWKSGNGAVSVGKADKTRQITNLAAGMADTDAVNVAQLKAIKQKIDNGAIHYFSVRSDDSAAPEGTNWNNDGASGHNAVAIGSFAKAMQKSATAVGAKTAAAGKGANAYGGGIAAGAGTVAIGQNAVAASKPGITQEEYDVLTRYQKTFYISDNNGLYYQYQHRDRSGKRTEDEQNYNIAIGSGAASYANQTVSLGYKAKSDVDGGVALGAESSANRQAGGIGYIATGSSATFEDALTTLNKKEDYDKWTAIVDASKKEYDDLTKKFDKATTKENKAEAKAALDAWKKQHADFVDALASKEKLEATWKGTKGAVSVGKDEINEAGNRVIASRQITNVAAGTEDTDAVNVAQLKTAKTTVKAGDYVTVSEGTNADGGKEYTVNGPKLAAKTGDTNIIVEDDVEEATKKKVGYKLSLNKTLTGFESITSDTFKSGDNVTINKEGLTITDGPSVTTTGIDANNTTITNVADGAADGDAVNFKQLKDVKTKVEANEGNITTNKNAIADLTPKVTANTANITKLQAGFTVKDGGAGKADVTLGGDTKQEVTFKAAVDKTTQATENGSSLTSTVDTNRNVTYSLNMKQLKKDLGITEGTDGVMSSWKLKATGGDTTEQDIKNGEAVTFDASGNGLTVTRTDSTIKYTIDGSKIDLAGNTSITGLQADIKNAKTTVEAGDYVTVTSEKKAGVDGTVYTVKGPTLSVDGGNLTVTDEEEAVAGTTDKRKIGYKLSLNKDLTGLTSVSSTTFKAGDNVTLGGTGLTITNGPSVTTAGINANNKTISNVADGAADGDAVNYKQLKDVDSKVTTNTEDITTLKKGWTLKDANTGTKTVKAEDTVKVTGDDYITATVGTDGLTLGMNETKLNDQINKQIDSSATVNNKMNSWVLKAATTDKDPAAKGQTIDNDNKVATFDVEKEEQGLTVARDGATIKYGVDKAKLAKHITGDVITNINDGTTAITNISAKFSISGADAATKKDLTLSKTSTPNIQFLGTDKETTVTVGGTDAAPTVKVGLAEAFKKQVTDNTSNIAENKTNITNLTGRVDGHDTAINENKTNITNLTTRVNANSDNIAANTEKIGKNTENIGKNTEAIGKNTTAITNLTTRVNANSDNIAANTEKIGKNTEAIGKNTEKIGKNTEAIGKNTEKIGKNTEAIGKNTEKIGKNTENIGKNTEKIGKNTENIEQNTKDIATKMTSWKLKAEGVEGEQEIKDGNAVTFDVAEANKGLTVTREGSTIKYGIDGKQIDISQNKTVNDLKDEIAKKKTVVKAGDEEKNISVVKTADKEEYTITLAKDLKDLNSVSAKTVNADTVSAKTVNADTVSAKTVNADAVNTKTVKASDKVTVGDKVTLGTTGLTIKDGPSVTAAGIDAGKNKITGVAAGAVSEKSTEAVNGGQLFGVEQKVNINSRNISILGGKVSELNTRVNRVGAGAAALAALHPLDFDPDDKWDFAAGYGNYKGANAAAIGAYYRPNEDTMVSVGGSFGGGENMVNAGVSVKLGQGNHVTTSRVAMAKEIKDLRAEVEVLRQAVTGIGQGQTPDPVKMKLFPDIAKNHWAYEAVEELTKQGLLEGYPDGTFGGDRMMTRYEFATLVYRAMQKGLNVNEKLIQEFEPELERFRIDVISKDKNGNPVIERVRVNEKKKAK